MQHVDESRKSDDGGGVTVVTNGSLELALALGNGRITTIKTDAAKRTGLGAEVEFTAVFKGIKESNGSDYVLEFDLPTKTSEGLVAMAFVFSDTNEAARSKWKAAVPGGNVRWQARVDGIAVWFIRPDKPSYLFALKDAKIME